jgi:hypothetical protein
MESRHRHVNLSGHLKGMEHEAECKVSAFEVPMPGSNGYEYALVMICDAPHDLPDGRYHLTFDSRAIPVQRHNGAWLVLVS